jgi:hypothetical protein
VDFNLEFRLHSEPDIPCTPDAPLTVKAKSVTERTSSQPQCRPVHEGSPIGNGTVFQIVVIGVYLVDARIGKIPAFWSRHEQNFGPAMNLQGRIVLTPA